MISYEISIGFTVLNVIICAGSFNLSTIVLAQQKIWFILPLLPIFIIFYISMLAETNRHPFLRRNNFPIISSKTSRLNNELNSYVRQALANEPGSVNLIKGVL